MKERRFNKLSMTRERKSSTSAKYKEEFGPVGDTKSTSSAAVVNSLDSAPERDTTTALRLWEKTRKRCSNTVPDFFQLFVFGSFSILFIFSVNRRHIAVVAVFDKLFPSVTTRQKTGREDKFVMIELLLNWSEDVIIVMRRGSELAKTTSCLAKRIKDDVGVLNCVLHKGFCSLRRFYAFI